MRRCEWAATALSIAYHDEEWGVPLHNDRALFELLVLEGAQAGLSWETILKKRESYGAAFANFDAAIIARWTERQVDSLLLDPGIVRNRRKVESAVANARGFLAIQEESGSFDAYVWGFVGGEPLQNCWRHSREMPARTALSDTLSADLRRRGFNFVGPTICYSFMQAMGMVNDHIVDCFRRDQF